MKKWTSKGGWVKDENAFLFLIRSSDSSQKCPILFEVKENPEFAMYHNKQRGPRFGMGPAINIGDKCNEPASDWSTSCYSCVCKEFNSGRSTFDYKGNQLCGGNQLDAYGTRFKFTVMDYEVFELKLL
eukprot:204629_1